MTGNMNKTGNPLERGSGAGAIATSWALPSPPVAAAVSDGAATTGIGEARPTRTKKFSRTGQWELTHRDMTVLRWLGEMGTADLRQVGTLLATMSDQQTITMARCRAIVQRWVDLGFTAKKRILADRATCVWLTRAGLDLVGLGGKGGVPGTASIEHTLGLADVRLHLRQVGAVSDGQWRSERLLRASLTCGGIQRQASRKHVPDAELWLSGSVTALEFERTHKGRRIDLIMIELAARYDMTYYIVNRSTRSLVTSALARLTPNERARFTVRASAQLMPSYLVTGR